MLIIIGVILFVGCFSLLGYFLWSDRVQSIKKVVPGAKFLSVSADGNPFLDDRDYRYVHAVENGWVRYSLGKDGNPNHSLKVGDFVQYYEHVENT